MRYHLWHILAGALMLVACASRASTSLPTLTISALAPTATYIPPTIAPTATHTPSPILSPAITPLPSSPFAFWYLENGTIYRYSLQNWKAERIALPTNGSVTQATLSSDGRRLVYADNEGVKFVSTNLKSMPISLPTKGMLINRGLRLSNDGEWLAYADQEGLKIAYLASRHAFLFLKHQFMDYADPQGIYKVRVYHPDLWSPDNKWLWIDVGYWEGAKVMLASLETGKRYDLPRCYYPIGWLSEDQSLLASVSASGYMQCGENDGLYQLNLTNNALVEKRIYVDTRKTSPYKRAIIGEVLNPNKDQIVFIQKTIEEPLVSQLLILSHNGENLIEVSRKAGTQFIANGISTPLWAKNNLLYYVEQVDEKSEGIYRSDLSTLKKQNIYIAPSAIRLQSLSPDEKWLAIFLVDQGANEKSAQLKLIGTSSNSLINISDKISGNEIYSSFLGWESLP